MGNLRAEPAALSPIPLHDRASTANQILKRDQLATLKVSAKDVRLRPPR